ncbi:leucine-rich repeat neuronal protein 2-like [Anopheles arabiensis]|uniref:Uncharacterized protein n=1 Tax=Anopheles arabiensis TaxID=7173 RepID=A0A182HRV5_ANOAR|nr:leucine-rich repeat neuronal protein 2-like [Anopheles arabiensis]
MARRTLKHFQVGWWLVRLWLMSGLMMPVIVYASDEPLQTAKVCQYMQCTVSENDGAQVRLRFNHTMWKQYSGSLNREFDFTSWSWSELDSVAEANPTLEVTFNGLEVPHVDILQGHDGVVSLNLDENQITVVEAEAFVNFKMLTVLSLRRNMITAVNELFYLPNKLQRLDLSNNWISEINGFKSFTWGELRHLNLSHNRIEALRTELSKLDALDTLDLSHNSIKKVDSKPIILSRSLRRLLFDHNKFTAWPFDSLPDTLVELSLSFNELETTKEGHYVRHLDLSSNRLASFCGHCYPALEELDLSGNYFDTIPKLSNATGNSIRKVSFNRMPHLQSVEKTAFEGAANLQEIEISFCPRLSYIEPHAFTDLKQLKRLDLSYNALQQVPEDMVHWKQITQGVDLQGNPFNCNCSMQWFVSKVIPAMHSNRELHKLFPKLRCAEPPMYKDYLLVYLTVHDNLLCRKYREMDLPGMEQVVQLMRDHRQMQMVRAQKIILACLIVGIIAMSLYLAYLKLNRPRYRVRPIYYQ